MPEGEWARLELTEPFFCALFLCGRREATQVIFSSLIFMYCFFPVGGQGVPISHFPYPVLSPPVSFCPFVFRLPPFVVFLPLSCKSRCLTPYPNRECFVQLAGLFKIKKLCCKSSHSALSSAIIEAAFLRHKFTSRGKIFSVSWTTVVRSELLGRSSMDGFFPSTPKITETDQNVAWISSDCFESFSPLSNVWTSLPYRRDEPLRTSLWKATSEPNGR